MCAAERKPRKKTARTTAKKTQKKTPLKTSSKKTKAPERASKTPPKTTKKKTTKKQPAASKSKNATSSKEVLLKTGEVLSESGISRQMLYRYMQMDLILPAETTPTGRNLFSESVFKQIKLIQSLNERYTLQHIREIFARRFSEKR